MLYLSEVSHNAGPNSLCFGGGYYRRGRLRNALVFAGDALHETRTLPFKSDNIDYYLGLEGNFAVGSLVIMCFRTDLRHPQRRSAYPGHQHGPANNSRALRQLGQSYRLTAIAKRHRRLSRQCHGEHSMNKFVVLVLDSFGVGAMEDVPQVRPNDIGADTCGHILQQCPDLRLPAMERLGLINSLGYRANVMEPNPQANVGKAALQHEGADSFMGHQEIMGTQPKQPLRVPFGEIMDETADALRKAGYRIQRLPVTANTAYLWVNDAVAVGDNLETDPGLVYNVTANLNLIDYDTVRKIGAIVRRCARVSRVIVFGGKAPATKPSPQQRKAGKTCTPASMPRSRASTDKASGSFIWDTASMRPYRSPPA